MINTLFLVLCLSVSSSHCHSSTSFVRTPFFCFFLPWFVQGAIMQTIISSETFSCLFLAQLCRGRAPVDVLLILLTLLVICQAKTIVKVYHLSREARRWGSRDSAPQIVNQARWSMVFWDELRIIEIASGQSIALLARFVT